jgi:hypothetical protein
MKIHGVSGKSGPGMQGDAIAISEQTVVFRGPRFTTRTRVTRFIVNSRTIGARKSAKVVQADS